MSETKRASTIDEYIDGCAEEVRPILQQARAAIRRAAPDAEETITYGMPTFDLSGRHLVFFAAWKRHISLYPLPAGDESLQQALSPYKQPKSTIQFPLNKPMPYELIETIVKHLIKERAS